MPALSFRVKLLLAMMLVVVGVAGATLYVAQQRFQETYRRALAKDFVSQTKLFLATQEFLLSRIKEACQTLVRGSRVREALRAATEESSADKLYGATKSELETRKVQPAFSLFLDAAGKLITPPESDEEEPRLVRQPNLRAQLEIVGRAVPKMEAPLVGFMTPEMKNSGMSLQQVVVTKIVDVDSDEPLGALAMGFPLPDLGEKAGVLFENRLYSPTLAEPMRQELAAKVAGQLKISEIPPDDFVVTVDQIPHRVFYQALNPDPHFPRAFLVVLISIKDALDAQRDLRAKIFLFGGLGLVGALTISLLLSHGLSVPIRELVAGTTEIQRGNLSVQVPVRSRDEIGQLAAAFNEMTQGLKLKETYRSVLDKVSDPAVAEELLKGVVALGGEMREISVLFCDIRGFTALSQGMHPDEVIRMLNEHFTPLTRVVNQNKGVVDKFVGDLIMAIFGAPKSYGNDAANAARCALEMIQTRRQLNATSQYQIEVGIGLASGPAVAGNMGSQERLNYTVLGERVNLASRLCGKAGRMEVVIDETTRQRLGSEVRVETLPDLELKGFSARVPAHKLWEICSPQATV